MVKNIIEKIKRKIPKKIEIDIDVKEDFPEGEKPFIGQDFLSDKENWKIEGIKERLVEEGFKEKDVTQALDETEIDFKEYLIMPDGKRVEVKWKKTDAWRGYYTLDIPDIDDTGIEGRIIGKDTPIKMSLQYVSRDPDENEKFLAVAISELEKAGFTATPIIMGTSNLFSVNTDLIVEPAKKWKEKRIDFIRGFNNAYVGSYTESFSIMTGTTSPINQHIKDFINQIRSLRKKKLEDVI